MDTERQDRENDYKYPEFSGEPNDEFYQVNETVIKAEQEKLRLEQIKRNEIRKRQEDIIKEKMRQEAREDKRREEEKQEKLAKEHQIRMEKEQNKGISGIKKKIDEDYFKEQYKDKTEKDREIENERIKRAQSESLGGWREELYNKKHPILGKITGKLGGASEYIENTSIANYVKERLGDSKDKRLIKNGVDTKTLEKYDKLKRMYDYKIKVGDTDTAKEEKNEIRKLEREIQQTVKENEKEKLKQEKELQKIKLDSASNVLSFESQKLKNKADRIKLSQSVREFDMAMSESKLRHNLLKRKFNKNNGLQFNNSVGFSKPNIFFPTVRGNQNLQYTPIAGRNPQDFAYARNRIEEKRQQELQAIELRRQVAAQRDARLGETFMKNDRLKASLGGRGTLPAPTFNNIGGLRRSGFAGMAGVSNIKSMNISTPRINLGSSMKVNNRITAIKNNKSNTGHPQNKLKYNIPGIVGIQSGIVNLVTPIKTRAAQHKAKVYHSPVCAIANIAGCTTSISHNHHANRKFGLDLAAPNLNIASRIAGIRRKKAKA